MELRKHTVIKHPRVFQSIFYLLKYEKEDLCERDTNKLFWKKAKEYLNEDFFKKIGSYQALGTKEDEYTAY